MKMPQRQVNAITSKGLVGWKVHRETNRSETGGENLHSRALVCSEESTCSLPLLLGSGP